MDNVKLLKAMLQAYIRSGRPANYAEGDVPDTEDYFLLDSEIRTQFLDELERGSRKFNHSRKSLDSLVSLIVFQLFGENTWRIGQEPKPTEEEIEQALSQMIESVEAKRDVLIPVVGLTLKSSPILIGEIEFYASDTLHGPLQEWVDAQSHDESGFSELAEDFIAAGTYARVPSLTGDHEHLHDIARQRVDDALHLIKLFTLRAKRSQDRMNKKIQVAGKLGERQRSIILIRRSLPKYGTSFRGENFEAFSLNIDNSMLPNWEKAGFKEILACFSSNQKSDIDRRIERSVRWYGKSHDTYSAEESFISLAIALEGLLIGPEGKNKTEGWGSITQKLAERVAFLLGSNLESRIRFEKRTKELYKIRSELVHNGETVVLADLYDFDAITASAIITLAKRNLKNWSEFTEWIQSEKYSPSSKS
jgi:hypothetical protein